MLIVSKSNVCVLIVVILSALSGLVKIMTWVTYETLYRSSVLISICSCLKITRDFIKHLPKSSNSKVGHVHCWRILYFSQIILTTVSNFH